MKSILLTTLNARFSHASLALRYLKANLNEYEAQTGLIEFTIKTNPQQIVERLLAEEPRVIGFGIYIWNVIQTTEVIRALRTRAPGVILVVGGPEVSHDLSDLELLEHVDHVVQGEGEQTFYELCCSLLSSEKTKPNHGNPLQVLQGPSAREPTAVGRSAQVWEPVLPDLNSIRLPYELYTDKDIAHRNIYVEASRGCPFRCEFCLSSLDQQVRPIPLEPFFAQLQRLIDRGARVFRFIDRTFNLKISTSQRILRFFLSQELDDLFLHFEMVPDRFPGELRSLIEQFPPGAVQFEIGIQTINPDVAKLIRRRMDLETTKENLTYLRQHTGVHIHADLIVGLPGENRASFFSGFDWLYKQSPHEIQVGVLKKLRGAPVARYQESHAMIYSKIAPYEILSTTDINEAEMKKLKRFSRYWDLYGNSGRFSQGLDLLMKTGRSPAQTFERFSSYSYEKLQSLHGLSLLRLMENLYQYCIEEIGLPPSMVRKALAHDYTKDSPRSLPRFLKGDGLAVAFQSTNPRMGQSRQSRHLR